MHKPTAFEVAQKRANKHKRPYYVIWSIEDEDDPPYHYHVATEDELDTFYNGISDANIIACVEPS